MRPGVSHVAIRVAPPLPPRATPARTRAPPDARARAPPAPPRPGQESSALPAAALAGVDLGVLTHRLFPLEQLAEPDEPWEFDQLVSTRPPEFNFNLLIVFGYSLVCCVFATALVPLFCFSRLHACTERSPAVLAGCADGAAAAAQTPLRRSPARQRALSPTRPGPQPDSPAAPRAVQVTELSHELRLDEAAAAARASRLQELQARAGEASLAAGGAGATLGGRLGMRGATLAVLATGGMAKQ